MSLKTMLSKFKSKQTSVSEKKKMLRDVEREEYKKEKEKVKAQRKVKDAERFLKDVEAAKRKGAERAQVGGKTHKIDTLISTAKIGKKAAKKGLQAADKALTVAAKISDNMERGMEEFVDVKPKRKPVTKKKVTKKPTKKKPATKKKATSPKKKATKKILTDAERERRALIAEGKQIAKKRKSRK